MTEFEMERKILELEALVKVQDAVISRILAGETVVETAPEDYKGLSFEKAVENFADNATEAVRAHYKRNNFTFAVPFVEVSKISRKYAKLVSYSVYKDGGGVETRGDDTVHSFVEVETGDIFKAASWKAPAKHARGNIYTPEGIVDALTADGHVRYMR